MSCQCYVSVQSVVSSNAIGLPTFLSLSRQRTLARRRRLSSFCKATPNGAIAPCNTHRHSADRMITRANVLLCTLSTNVPPMTTIVCRPPLPGPNLVARYFHDEKGVNSEGGVLGKLLTRLTPLSILLRMSEQPSFHLVEILDEADYCDGRDRGGWNAASYVRRTNSHVFSRDLTASLSSRLLRFLSLAALMTFMVLCRSRSFRASNTRSFHTISDISRTKYTCIIFFPTTFRTRQRPRGKVHTRCHT